MQQTERAKVLADLSENVMYLMGFSFVLGSLCTILILIALDVIRRHSIVKQPPAKPVKVTKTAAKPARKRK